MSYLIELQNVTKIYQSGNTVYQALQGIDFQLMQGEMIAIVGASGSGKSTLMNILGLLDRCTTGHYYFSGQDVAQLSEQAHAKIRNTKIGFVFQSFFLLSRSNALQNVMLPLFYSDTPRELAKQKAFEMLAKVGIEHLAQHRPNQLSGGQQQRVAIARALVNSPQVILADEPTGALDSQTSQEVLQLFSDLNRKDGTTIVIITHDKEVSQRCQRIITIKDGRIDEKDNEHAGKETSSVSVG